MPRVNAFQRTRLGFALAALSLCATSALAAPAACERREVSEDQAWALHSKLLTLDTHIDLGRGYASHTLDPGRFTRAQNDLPKMRAGGLDAAFLIIYTGQAKVDGEGYAAARANAEDDFRRIQRLVRAYPDQVALARSADEVVELHRQGRIAVLLGMENAYPLGDSVADVGLWAERGVRYVGLTHMGHNQFGGSSNPNAELGDGTEDAGLTELGRELVRSLNDHGVLVDISHVGKRSMMEATRLSRAPVIASHSGASGVYANARNLDDEQLDAIRENGGVAQMVAFRSYVAEVDPALAAGIAALRSVYIGNGWDAASDADIEAYAAGVAALRAKHPDVTLAQFVDHIDHAVRRIGIEHVGIASDFDGGGGVQGWDDASETANVTRELMARCYSESQIQALWSGNLLRALRAAEKAKSQAAS
ncbi:dipeptidase [Pseudomarimonas salicorniae]|uniref:Dipeptidase n=1 Tax=Pseudomarimonas salicorniae TaxID=2933270 RepID=A0ABT0GHZ1_9GAMM|nr:dipeptidase [Lysobacter sp. CAU 1642]MCK7594170.1 dipeptidase [Lysobacter sp. CAU 1642]